MTLSFREANIKDFDGFYRACYSTFGYGDDLRASVLHDWQVLMAYPTTLSLTVEDLDRKTGDEVLGFAQAVFVSDEFAHWAMSHMPPYVNTHLTSNWSQHLLDSEAVRVANAGDGLNMFMTRWGWAEPPLSAAEATVVRNYTAAKFWVMYGGYNVKQMFIEVSGQEAVRMAINAGFRQLRDYTDYYSRVPPPPSHLHPYLLGVSREEARNDVSYISRFLAYTPPRYFLEPLEQEVLRAAMIARFDKQIAPILYKSVAAVKSWWMRIYERVDEVDPLLLQGLGGAQRRHALLKYLEDHHEELCPANKPQSAK